jgi:predicted nucleotide-binding protein
MASTFKGTIEQLKEAIESGGLIGTWTEASGKHSFRSQDGGILNWWPKNGTLQLQGGAEGKASIQQAIDAAPATTPAKALPIQQKTTKNIFIVHGHDSTARDQMELVLHRLGLEPFILMNTSGGGKTIVEALEGQIGRDFASDFGIVLMTPDDMGYAQKEGEAKKEPRARQNVILETGMLLASLTRQRMAIVIKGHLEMPSDLQGIIHFGYNDHVREIVPKLCQRLKESGFDLSPQQIANAAQ